MPFQHISNRAGEDRGHTFREEPRLIEGTRTAPVERNGNEIALGKVRARGDEPAEGVSHGNAERGLTAVFEIEEKTPRHAVVKGAEEKRRQIGMCRTGRGNATTETDRCRREKKRVETGGTDRNRHAPAEWAGYGPKKMTEKLPQKGEHALRQNRKRSASETPGKRDPGFFAGGAEDGSEGETAHPRCRQSVPSHAFVLFQCPAALRSASARSVHSHRGRGSRSMRPMCP